MTSVAVRLFRPQDVPIQAAGRSPLIALRSRRRKPARPAARSAIMTDLNIRFHRLVAIASSARSTTAILSSTLGTQRPRADGNTLSGW